MKRLIVFALIVFFVVLGCQKKPDTLEKKIEAWIIEERAKGYSDSILVEFEEALWSGDQGQIKDVRIKMSLEYRLKRLLVMEEAALVAGDTALAKETRAKYNQLIRGADNE